MPLVGPLRYEHPPHLPPVELAPILESYDPDLKRVEDGQRLEAPIDSRGIVDIFKTVELALSLVDDEYIWPRSEPEPDVHHFVWERDKYHPRNYGGSQIPRDYRDKISFHKGYLPRQLHEFIHATIAPPPVPDFSVMEARVRDYERAVTLFVSARGAVTAKRKPGKISGVPISPESGRVLLDEEILMQIMNNFQGYFQNSMAGMTHENEFVAVGDILEQPPEVVARHLGRIAGLSAINLMPLVYGQKRRTRLAA
jgi:hypothetical protein